MCCLDGALLGESSDIQNTAEKTPRKYPYLKYNTPLILCLSPEMPKKSLYLPWLSESLCYPAISQQHWPRLAVRGRKAFSYTRGNPTECKGVALVPRRRNSVSGWDNSVLGETTTSQTLLTFLFCVPRTAQVNSSAFHIGQLGVAFVPLSTLTIILLLLPVL